MKSKFKKHDGNNEDNDINTFISRNQRTATTIHILCTKPITRSRHDAMATIQATFDQSSGIDKAPTLPHQDSMGLISI